MLIENYHHNDYQNSDGNTGAEPKPNTMGLTQTTYYGLNAAVHILAVSHIIHLLEDAGAHLWQGASVHTAIGVRWD